MLRIWGRTNSINVQKVMWAVGELGLTHERIDAGGKFGGLDSAQYGAMNPNRKVPTIDDGDGAERVVLWESNVVVRYLCARHAPGRMYPEPLAERFDAERWMDWAFSFQAAFRPVFWGLVRTPPER